MEISNCPRFCLIWCSMFCTWTPRITNCTNQSLRWWNGRNSPWEERLNYPECKYAQFCFHRPTVFQLKQHAKNGHVTVFLYKTIANLLWKKENALVHPTCKIYIAAPTIYNIIDIIDLAFRLNAGPTLKYALFSSQKYFQFLHCRGKKFALVTKHAVGFMEAIGLGR